MNDADMRRFLVEQEISRAEEKVATTRNEVERLSHEHLNASINLPKPERARRIDNAELVASDRKILVNSLIIDLASDGFRPATESWSMDHWRRLWGLNRHRAPGFAKRAIPLILVGVCLVITYRNTGQLVPGRRPRRSDLHASQRAPISRELSTR